jgi:hypothetical protein
MASAQAAQPVKKNATKIPRQKASARANSTFVQFERPRRFPCSARPCHVIERRTHEICISNILKGPRLPCVTRSLPSKNRNIPCLAKRPLSPKFRRMTAFSPSQATLTVEFTVSVEKPP